ncbi:AMP-binding enzyme [Enteractinococcus coprophilus]|uniref:AMP-binding enzyme n=1 Tax=Enteractinococcus coprophilus TaxID=1027633 RepID=A0A543AMY1_9MICC|nr:AMP-binding protein [Enteractinococcus coprophilus]TQL73933.1 AMP-binding enzyme [Enteractinococcus coprophilus]
MPRNLSLINAARAADALAQALSVRADGGVPLITDPRAPIADDALAISLPEAAAWAVLTSGTTGAPKIVVRTADSWRVAFAPLNAELGLRPGDGLWMPVHQVSSMALFSAAWAQESHLALVIPETGDPGLNRAVAAHLTPLWLEHLVKLLEAGTPSTIDTVLVGGDRLPAQLAENAERLGLRVVPYVGASELSLVAWDTGDGMQAFDGVTTRIIDGELWVASQQLALDVIGGTLRTEVIDGVRWATVGDRVHETDGILEFLGRGDGAILTAGATVVPADVERVITAHPQVAACLVLGQPDAVLGQRVVAWIVGNAEISELRAWARSRLPKAARPVQWHRVNQLPRTPSGKIRRVVPEVA